MTWWKGLFYPRAVAVAGSVAEGKIGRVLIDQLLAGGFTDVVAVNPRGEGIRGVPGVTTLNSRPHDASAIDLIMIASPASTVANVLEDAGAVGVKVAVIITAGFSEIGAVAEEQEILETSRRHGIRLVGPNCAGIVNTKHQLFPTLETRPPAGDVAFVSQSGALGGAVLSWAEDQGVGFSKFISYGNGADLTEIDFLDALRTDADTKVVALYLETVSDGRRFMQAARRLTEVKPLIVIKSGTTPEGQQATLSHTGSMAGADVVYDAALAQCGALRVEGIEEMFDRCRGFVSLPPIRGKRVAIVTNSGGPGVLTADAGAQVGLTLPRPSPKLSKRLAEMLPPFCARGNPIDLTVQGDEAGYREILSAVLEEYDAAVAIDVNTPYLDSAPIARGIVAAAARTAKPVAAVFMAGKTVASALPVLRRGGVPTFPTGERAVRVLGDMFRYRARQLPAELFPMPVERSEMSLPWSGQGLEPEVLNWLDTAGLPVLPRRWVHSAEEAAAAAEHFGGLVAAKTVASAALHKTDVGGVMLGLEGAEEAAEAYRDLERRTQRYGFQGSLIVPMVEHAVEVIVGVSNDAQFGPVVLVGLGGIYTEVFHDLALRVAPIGPQTANAMIEELRCAPLFQGARGGVPLDLEGLVRVMVRVSRLPFEYADVGQLDLNPVFLSGEGVTIGDARLIRASATDRVLADRGYR